MKVLNTEVYEKDKKECNEDYYSRSVVIFAERWADLMEKELGEGSKIKDIALDLSHKADTVGISGFMYNMAIVFLSKHWVYGKELVDWHNSKYGYKGEDIVNSSIISIMGRK